MTTPTNSPANFLPQFPAELKALPAWCVWRYEERDGKQTKVPYCPVKLADGNYTTAPAQSNNSQTWVSFVDACAAVCGQDEFQLGVFADGFHTFIDLDKCVGSEGPEAWALGVLERTNSYAELSPSGTGQPSQIRHPAGVVRPHCWHLLSRRTLVSGATSEICGAG
jgi:putative DNA primase/helicase